MNLEDFLCRWDDTLRSALTERAYSEIHNNLLALRDHYVTVGQSFEDLGIFDESEETTNDSPRLD